MPGINYHRLLERLVGPPLLITPDKAQQLLGVLANRAGWTGQLIRADADDDGDGGPVRLEALAADAMRGDRPDRKTFALVDGIAIIPVEGVLVNKLGTLDPWCGMTGYDGLAVKLADAVADPEVRAILFDIDSPGGEVAGCFDLADRIFAARQIKPVWAACTEEAYSAAFALASQCDRILVPRTGGAGSVGVVCLHADFSRMLDEAGIKVTLIHAGAHKVDGNPYQPLPEDVRDTIQAEIEGIRTLFADTVARGRSMDAADVLATEARCLVAAEAVKTGFADEVASPDDAFAAFQQFLAGDAGSGATGATTREERSKPMSLKDRAALKAAEEDKAKKAKTAKTAAEEEPEDDPEKDPEEDPEEGAAAEEDEDGEDDKEDAAKAASSPEKRRIAGILTSAEAKGREDMARTLALETDLSVAAAVRVLATAPKGGGKAGAFATAMAAHAGPAIGAETETETRRTAGLHAAIADQAKRSGLKIEEVK